MKTYLKGKDIKVPFDCLWHCYTRSFEARYVQRSEPRIILTKDNKVITWECVDYDKPEDFDKF